MRRVLPAGTVLVVGDPQHDLATALVAIGASVERWDRRVLPERKASPCPPAGPFDVAALRLPQAKDELAMTLHMVANVLRPGGSLMLFGANDEGIKSVASRLAPLFTSVRTVATGGHCRVLSATLNDDAEPVRAVLEDWGSAFDPKIAELKKPWVGYPGVFAHGSVDPGSRLLIEALPAEMSDLRVLDYGCGTGLLGGVSAARSARVDLLDVDTVALEAARLNVPGMSVLPGDSLDVCGTNTYDMIVSNPPIHRGKGETRAALEGLINGGPKYLEPHGSLYFVVQKRVKVQAWLEAAFHSFERVGSDRVFNVFHARRP